MFDEEENPFFLWAQKHSKWLLPLGASLCIGLAMVPVIFEESIFDLALNGLAEGIVALFMALEPKR